MQDCKLNILGTEYEIKFGNEEKYPSLEGLDGYCDSSTKEIVVDDMKKSEGQVGAKGNLRDYQKTCLRHEIIHAFMEESGLSNNFEHKTIGIEETVVDWFAIQSPKIFKVFKELDLLLFRKGK